MKSAMTAVKNSTADLEKKQKKESVNSKTEHLNYTARGSKRKKNEKGEESLKGSGNSIN